MAKLTFERRTHTVSVAMLGHVDHGKTTLTAAIEFVLGAGCVVENAGFNAKFESTQLERGRGIAGSAKHVEYEANSKRYTFIDGPAHADMVKNNIADGVQMDSAILVVSATDSPMAQTREHVLLARQAGIEQVVVFLNKCDLVDDVELLALVELEVRELLAWYDYPGAKVPVIFGSAKLALERDQGNFGVPAILALLEALDRYLPRPERDRNRPFLMAIEDTFAVAGRGTIVTGRVERGMIEPGDEVEIVGMRSTIRTTVVALELSRRLLDQAQAGDYVGLLLRGVSRTDVKRGQVLAKPGTISQHSQFIARAYLLTKEEGGRSTPIPGSFKPQFNFRTTDVYGTLVLPTGQDAVLPGTEASFLVSLATPIAMHEGMQFAIREGGRTVGAGVVAKIVDAIGDAPVPFPSALDIDLGVRGVDARLSAQRQRGDVRDLAGALKFEREVPAPPPPSPGLPGSPALPQPPGPLPAPPNTHPTFHLRFEGEALQGDHLLRECNCELVFAEGVAKAAGLAVSFLGKKLTKAVIGDSSELILVVWASDGIELVGSGVAVARFHKGHLLEDVRFSFRVGKECPEEASVTVEFFSEGRRLYSVALRAAVFGDAPTVLSTLAPAPAPASTIELQDLDLLDSTSAPGPRDWESVLLKLQIRSGGLHISMDHMQRGRLSKGLEATIDNFDTSSLQTLLMQVRKELGEDFYASDIWDRSVIKASTSGETDALRECFERVASAGSIMFDALCAKSTAARALFEYIDQLPLGTRLTISTLQVLLPFEILYGQAFRKNWPAERRQERPVVIERFWGVRFAVEVVVMGAQNYDRLAKAHARSKLAVSMNLNSTIKGRGTPAPSEIHSTLIEDLTQRGVTCATVNSCADFQRVLYGAESDARLVYVYCHGTAADPNAGSQEELDLGDGCALRPTDVYAEQRFASAPIVFLNACFGGASSPMFFTGFLEAFRKQDALGLIASHFPVPIMFGATFGSEVVKQCVLGDGALGERMRKLRAVHAGRLNPTPLFYSAQCQL